LLAQDDVASTEDFMHEEIAGCNFPLAANSNAFHWSPVIG
jgi:hypothetical protein